MPRMGLRSLFAAIVLVGLACGGGSGPPTGPGPNPSPSATVSLGATSFSPASVTIQTGGTVTWSNTSGVTHNVTFAATAGAPASIPDHTSGSNTRTFNSLGTFAYNCTLHGGMNGSVSTQ